MSIDAKTVDKLANLSRLEFDSGAKEEIAEELTKIMDFVSQLQECNTDQVEPMSSAVVSTSTPERDDEIKAENDRDALLNVSPSQEMGFYVVPRVVE